MKLPKIISDKLKWVSPPKRFFAKNKFYTDPVIEIENTKYKFVYIGAGLRGSVHNHKGQKMEEWHYIISGSGWCILYNEDGSIRKKTRLVPGKFSPRMDSDSPNHEFVCGGGEPLVFLAIERYF